MTSAELELGSGLLTVTFDQPIEPGSITAQNFVARPSPGVRYRNTTYNHIGGSVIGPMATTLDSGIGSSPRADFRDVPSGEVVNATTGAAVQELNFPLNVV